MLLSLCVLCSSNRMAVLILCGVLGQSDAVVESVVRPIGWQC